MEEDPESEHETTKIDFSQYYRSPFSRYASKQMSYYNFSEQKKFTIWRRLWVNLAKQQKVCWYTLLSLKVKHVHLFQFKPVSDPSRTNVYSHFHKHSFVVYTAYTCKPTSNSPNQLPYDYTFYPDINGGVIQIVTHSVCKQIYEWYCTIRVYSDI